VSATIIPAETLAAKLHNFRKALELTELTSEQLFLSKRLRDSEERRLRVVA